jgi:hypothetical protein
LRAKPHIQVEIAPLRARADAIAAPVALNLIEKRRRPVRVVRVNLALRDPKIDGEMLVSHNVDEGHKLPSVSTIRICDEFVAIKLGPTRGTTGGRLRYSRMRGVARIGERASGHIDTAKRRARLVSVSETNAI